MGEWKTIEPNVWKPEEEEAKIEGVLLHKEDAIGELSARYKLENSDGIYLVWGSAVLDDRMSCVSVGEKVRITYKGKSKNKRGQDVKIFKVEKYRDDPQVSDDGVGKEYDLQDVI